MLGEILALVFLGPLVLFASLACIALLGGAIAVALGRD